MNKEYPRVRDQAERRFASFFAGEEGGAFEFQRLLAVVPISEGAARFHRFNDKAIWHVENFYVQRYKSSNPIPHSGWVESQRWREPSRPANAAKLVS